MLRPKVKHLANFFHQLSTMYDSGLPLLQALRTLQRTTGMRMAPVVRRLAERIESGQKLGEAMRAYPRTFPSLAVGLIEVGEESGTMDRICRELSRYYSWSDSLKKRIISGLIYPAVELTLAVIIIAIFLYLMPRFAPEASPFGPTAYSRFLTVVICIVAGGVILWKSGRFFIPGRYAFHALLAEGPIIGRLYRKIVLGRFAFVLYLTNAAGVPIVEGLHRAATATGNLVYQKAAQRIAGNVLAGSSLAEAMRHSRLFTPDFVSIIEVGEESGRLDEVTLKLAERYREEAEHAIGILVTVGSFLAWGAVAGFLATIIILGYMRFYVGAINNIMGK